MEFDDLNHLRDEGINIIERAISVYVVGSAGSGKSAFLNALLARQFFMEETAFVISDYQYLSHQLRTIDCPGLSEPVSFLNDDPTPSDVQRSIDEESISYFIDTYINRSRLLKDVCAAPSISAPSNQFDSYPRTFLLKPLSNDFEGIVQEPLIRIWRLPNARPIVLELLQKLSDQFLLLYKHFIVLFKKILIEAIRFQCVAYQIHNKVARSPTPQKKEPFVGGVKVGGKQHDISRHVAEILYLKPILMSKQAA